MGVTKSVERIDVSNTNVLRFEVEANTSAKAREIDQRFAASTKPSPVSEASVGSCYFSRETASGND